MFPRFLIACQISLDERFFTSRNNFHACYARSLRLNRKISKYRHRERYSVQGLEMVKVVELLHFCAKIFRVKTPCYARMHNFASASLSLERGAVMRARHETSGILSRRGRLLVLFARNERTKITFPVWNHATKEWRDICVVARYL